MDASVLNPSAIDAPAAVVKNAWFSWFWLTSPFLVKVKLIRRSRGNIASLVLFRRLLAQGGGLSYFGAESVDSLLTFSRFGRENKKRKSGPSIQTLPSDWGFAPIDMILKFTNGRYDIEVAPGYSQSMVLIGVGSCLRVLKFVAPRLDPSCGEMDG